MAADHPEVVKKLRGDYEAWWKSLEPALEQTVRYGLGGATVETLEDVGKRFDITRERVRQIQNSAVLKLREMLDAQDRPATEEEEEKKKPAKKTKK